MFVVSKTISMPSETTDFTHSLNRVVGMDVPPVKPPPPAPPPVLPGRERSPPQRSSVKAPPRDVRPPWPPVKAPPPAMPLLARVEREEMAEMKELLGLG